MFGQPLVVSPSSVLLLIFVDKTGKRRTAVLALPQLQETHNGENLAGVLLQIFDEYDIRKRIGFLMTDNADNNDTCVC